MIDWPIVGTDLLLRITETGAELKREEVQRIIDSSLHIVVAKINSGRGSVAIEHGQFSQLTLHIDLRIYALEDQTFTYFVLGKQFVVFAHVVWQAIGLWNSCTPTAHPYQNLGRY